MRTRLYTLALATAIAAPAFAGAQTVKLAARGDSKLWIEGNSNVHAWSCNATKFETSVDADAAVRTPATNFAGQVKNVELKVPVDALDCGHGAMNKNLRKAVKSDKYPAIEYSLTSYTVKPGAAADTYTLQTVGTLAVAGQKSTVKADVSATRLADGTIRAQGTVPILMSEYGIKPPTAMLGALKTDNKVTVRFDLHLATAGVVASTEQ